MAKLQTVGTEIAASRRTAFHYEAVRNPPLGVCRILVVRWQRQLTIHDAGFGHGLSSKSLLGSGLCVQRGNVSWHNILARLITVTEVPHALTDFSGRYRRHQASSSSF